MANNNIPQILKSLETKYSQKEYGEAIDLLLKNKDGLDPGLFSFNLGTLYAKKGDFATARYHLENSISKGFLNSFTVKNHNFILAKLNANYNYYRESLIDTAMSYSLALPSSMFLSLSLTFVVIGLIICRNVKKYTIPIMAFFILMAGGVGLFKYHIHEKYQVGIVLNDVKLREGPSQIFDVSDTLDPGQKVILGKRIGNWFMVEFPLAISGWLESKELGIIDQ